MRAQDARQFRNQQQQIVGDLQDIRKQLSAAGMNAKDLTQLDEAMRALQALNTENAYGDTKGLQAEAKALDELKKAEFDLRKKLDTSNQQLFLNGTDEVAPGFRELVEKYYKALSKKGGGGGGR